MRIVSSTAFANGKQIKEAARRVDGEPRRVGGPGPEGQCREMVPILHLPHVRMDSFVHW